MARGASSRILPAATYDITASAYGYLPETVTGVLLPTGGVTQNFVLQAAPSVAPQVSISGDLTATRFTWTHVAPNTTYTMHRAPEPYFTPAPDNQKESLGLPFADTIIYDDPDGLTGSGNQFYAVVGKNAAGAGAPADGWRSSASTCSQADDGSSVRLAVTVRARAASHHFESVTRDEFA